MPRRPFVLLALLAATAFGAVAQDAKAPSPEERDATGRTPFDLKVEDALARGDVLAREPTAEGITHPELLTLRLGGVQLRAIFKTVNEETRGLSRTNVAEQHFTDRYVYELAAYRLDRLFRIDLVPPTIVREIEGKRGSVQYWIEDAISVGKAIADGHQPKDAARFRRNKISMNVLDALIHNIDRQPTNVLVTPADDGFYLIDHSRSFREEKTLPPFLVDWDGTLEPRIAARLREVKDDEIRAALAGLVTEKQIKAVVARRERLVRKLAELKLLPTA